MLLPHLCCAQLWGSCPIYFTMSDLPASPGPLWGGNMSCLEFDPSFGAPEPQSLPDCCGRQVSRRLSRLPGSVLQSGPCFVLSPSLALLSRVCPVCPAGLLPQGSCLIHPPPQVSPGPGVICAQAMDIVAQADDAGCLGEAEPYLGAHVALCHPRGPSFLIQTDLQLRAVEDSGHQGQGLAWQRLSV